MQKRSRIGRYIWITIASIFAHVLSMTIFFSISMIAGLTAANYKLDALTRDISPAYVISLSIESYRKDYCDGDSFDIESIEFHITYSSGTYNPLNYADVKASKEILSSKDRDIVISYTDPKTKREFSFNVPIEVHPLTSIENPSKQNYLNFAYGRSLYDIASNYDLVGNYGSLKKELSTDEINVLVDGDEYTPETSKNLILLPGNYSLVFSCKGTNSSEISFTIYKPNDISVMLNNLYQSALTSVVYANPLWSEYKEHLDVYCYDGTFKVDYKNFDIYDNGKKIENFYSLMGNGHHTVQVRIDDIGFVKNLREITVLSETNGAVIEAEKVAITDPNSENKTPFVKIKNTPTGLYQEPGEENFVVEADTKLSGLGFFEPTTGLGIFKPNNVIEFHFYSEKSCEGMVELTGAPHWLIGTDIKERMVGDVILSQALNLKVNDIEKPIANSIVFKNLYVEYAYGNFMNYNQLYIWQTVNLGEFTFNEGWNVISFTFKDENYFNELPVSNMTNLPKYTNYNGSYSFFFLDKLNVYYFD